MARGFLSGILWGGVLGVGAASVTSVLTPLPEAPRVTLSAPEATAAQPQHTDDSGAEATSGSDGKPQATTSAPTGAPAPDTLSALNDEALAPGKVPQTGPVGDLAAPGTMADAGAVQMEGDDPVLPNPLALAPMEPQPADDLSISTEPAQPPAPEPEAGSAFDEPGSENDAPATDVATSEEPETPPAPAPQVAGTDPVAPSAPIPDAQTGFAPSAGDAQTPQTDAPAVTSATPAEETPVVVTETTPPQVPEPETDEAQEESEEDSRIAALVPSTRPSIGTPAVPLTERESAVAVNRPSAPSSLPQAGSVEEPAGVPQDVAADTELRPIEQFSQPFDNPDGKPVMSIVLIDDGSGPTSGQPGIAALRSFPNAVSFAVDAALPDAAERMALYRDAGYEVLAAIDLPEGAGATDAETVLSAALTQMDQVVGVLEGTGTGLQASRGTAEQVNAILASTGHGLVTQNKGLNTMPKLARKEGVPAAPVFRDFDSNGQTATVIRRFLDQAAFKAGQEGAVIMLGRMRPDTISALLLWGLQDRAGQVAIAPVSAVLLREDG